MSGTEKHVPDTSRRVVLTALSFVPVQGPCILVIYQILTSYQRDVPGLKVPTLEVQYRRIRPWWYHRVHVQVLFTHTEHGGLAHARLR